MGDRDDIQVPTRDIFFITQKKTKLLAVEVVLVNGFYVPKLVQVMMKGEANPIEGIAVLHSDSRSVVEQFM